MTQRAVGAAAVSRGLWGRGGAGQAWTQQLSPASCSSKEISCAESLLHLGAGSSNFSPFC